MRVCTPRLVGSFIVYNHPHMCTLSHSSSTPLSSPDSGPRIPRIQPLIPLHLYNYHLNLSALWPLLTRAALLSSLNARIKHSLASLDISRCGQCEDKSTFKTSLSTDIRAFYLIPALTIHSQTATKASPSPHNFHPAHERWARLLLLIHTDESGLFTTVENYTVHAQVRL